MAGRSYRLRFLRVFQRFLNVVNTCGTKIKLCKLLFQKLKLIETFVILLENLEFQIRIGFFDLYFR